MHAVTDPSELAVKDRVSVTKEKANIYQVGFDWTGELPWLFALRIHIKDTQRWDVEFVREEKIYDTLIDYSWEPKLPRAFIKSDILRAHNLTQNDLAKRLGVGRKSVNELVVGRRTITTDMALRLEALTGKSANYWLTLQMQYDLWKTKKDLDELDIAPL